MEQIVPEIRPLDRDGLADSQSSCCEKRNQRCIWLFELIRNRIHLPGGQNRADHSSSAGSLGQLYTSAGILFEPAAIVGPSQRESQNDPHAAKGALAVLASFLRKEVLNIFPVDLGDLPFAELGKNVSA